MSPAPRLMLRTVMLWNVSMLVGLIVLGTHIWTIDKEFLDSTKDLDYFVASVELLWLISMTTTQKRTHTGC